MNSEVIYLYEKLTDPDDLDCDHLAEGERFFQTYNINDIQPKTPRNILDHLAEGEYDTYNGNILMAASIILGRGYEDSKVEYRTQWGSGMTFWSYEEGSSGKVHSLTVSAAGEVCMD
jgi:hypothetical protein